MATKLKKSADGRLFVVHDCPHCTIQIRHRIEEIGQSDRCKECGGHLSVPGQDLYQAYLRTQSTSPAPSESISPLKLDLSNPAPFFADTVKTSGISAKRNRPGRESSSAFTSPSGTYSAGPSFDHSQSDEAFDDYIAMTTHDNERIVLQFGPSETAVLTLQIVVALMTLIWLLIVIGTFMNGRGDFLDRPGTVLGGTLIIAAYGFLILVLPSLIALLRILKRKYTITDQRIVSRSGLVSLSVHEVKTADASGISTWQTLFGRLFGYGTVHVYADGTSVKLISVDHPIAVAAAVRSVVAER